MTKPTIRSFWGHESGAVAASYAIALTGLVAVGGVAFDYARMAGLDSELQNGADQAALAGATQLDKAAGSCARAGNAAVGMLRNITLLANDGAQAGIEVRVNGGTTIGVTDNACTSFTGITFFKKDRTTPATDDDNAYYIQVAVEARTAEYAFTPIVGLTEATMRARAMAGVGSAVCKVPPIMICHPEPGTTIDWDTLRGIGIQATGHNPGNSGNSGGNAGTGSTGPTWSPGNFGFLQVEDPNAANRNAALLRALAYANPPIDCVAVDENKVSTGNPQGLYDAINTRFDIYDFNSSGNGNVLASCQDGNCPPSSNVVKDFQNDNPTGNNACKIGNNGWKMPNNEFKPVSANTGPYYHDADDDGIASANGEAVDAMGLPRDLCHYTTFSGTGACGSTQDSGRFGNGQWAIYDYFKKNHDRTSPPPGVTTRYDAYRWELGLLGTGGSVPNNASQRGVPVCFRGAAAPEPSRRILTVAVVENCSELNGSSQAVEIGDWIDVFLVEPASDDPKRHNAYRDAIYLEVIGRSRLAGSGTFGSQEVRRDTPYLIE